MELNLRLAIVAAIKAGDEILKIYNEDDYGIELKPDQSPLTKADRNAHQVIVGGLKASGLPVLSEEGTAIPYRDRSKGELIPVKLLISPFRAF